jgi:hypothetical protein
MPRRSLLSNEQRTRLFAIPVDHAEMAKHYVLSADDLALVRTKRRSVNRLGFAIELCLLRHPGQGLGPGEPPPEAMIGFVAHQLGVSPAAFADYALRDQTRREHAVELQMHLHLRGFRLADWRACLQVGTDTAWATDRGEPIVRAMLAHLRAANVLVPAAAVLERIGLTARVRARKRVFQALADGLTEAERAALDALLTVDPELRRSRFAWLRDYSESPAPSNILELLNRLEYVRGLKMSPDRAGWIHATRLGRLVDEGAIMTAQHIVDLEPVRRTAILVGQNVVILHRVTFDGPITTLSSYPGSQILGLVMDPQNYRHLFVLDRDSRVWGSFDEGVSWIELTANLPTMSNSIRAIEFVRPVAGGKHTVLVAGGLDGAFQLRNPRTGAHWTKLSTKLPHGLVLDLHYDANNDVLVAGFLGRGAWTLTGFFQSNIDIASVEPPPGGGRRI